MDASVKGCLNNLNKSYRIFTYEGKSMTKPQVKAILEYADKKGYNSTSQLSDEEISTILNQIK